ncbi:TetR/AcrR family transcriptional regulator [Dyella marensis]|jgi:AcrR family transcriptional regulator|uniref:Transcriptional regulator, TetR family n=1 Tax=Dyella marensis TaxID=500610 RepID=A0A1I2CFQ7_9GAMM|nr:MULTISPECIES: TetR/AcrR family transcriptional regulator [Dyella]SFE67126.1 transcriptional regulator, TetR family [Dyella marensis]
MPYTAEHKQKTRQRIVECARELFNRRGFSEVSIDEIMRHAGLTRGGFYNHFKAKEELYAETVAAYMHFDPSQRWSGIRFDPQATGTACAQQMVNIYLSTAHLQDVEGHCPLVALPADAARAGPQARMAYCKLVEHMAGMLSGGLEGFEGEEARKRGLAITALCVGGMVLARTIDDPAFVEEVRLAARDLALQLIGPDAGTSIA